jgi:hypothetical protein
MKKGLKKKLFKGFENNCSTLGVNNLDIYLLTNFEILTKKILNIKGFTSHNFIFWNLFLKISKIYIYGDKVAKELV